MPILAATLALALANATPSPTTMAAVRIFEVNVDRQWPADEREPLVTVEALRLMTAAVRGLADDGKVNDGKLRDAITSLDQAREALSVLQRDDRDRARATRNVLDDGRVMIDLLAAALGAANATASDRGALKKIADGFDQKRPVEQQAGELQKYFQQAARLLRSMLDAEAART